MSIVDYVWKRLVIVMNSCTVKMIYELKAMENLSFPCKRVLQCFAMWGKISIVFFLWVLKSGQYRRKCSASSFSAVQGHFMHGLMCRLKRSKFKSLILILSLQWAI